MNKMTCYVECDAENFGTKSNVHFLFTFYLRDGIM